MAFWVKVARSSVLQAAGASFFGQRFWRFRLPGKGAEGVNELRVIQWKAGEKVMGNAH